MPDEQQQQQGMYWEHQQSQAPPAYDPNAGAYASYDYGQSTTPYDPSSPYVPQPMDGGDDKMQTEPGFEDEPPLLVELGVNPDHIMQKVRRGRMNGEPAAVARNWMRRSRYLSTPTGERGVISATENCYERGSYLARRIRNLQVDLGSESWPFRAAGTSTAGQFTLSRHIGLRALRRARNGIITRRYET